MRDKLLVVVCNYYCKNFVFSVVKSMFDKVKLLLILLQENEISGKFFYKCRFGKKQSFRSCYFVLSLFFTDNH